MSIGLFSTGGLAVVAALAVLGVEGRAASGAEATPHVLRLTIAMFLFVIAASYLADPTS